ncbi:MAG TPA: NAD(P)/FAD-dependent oxidoreductase [Solirubrobacteraceae bacterium]|nr:NAD(P)/FAD-dependent oxidoreductase [Solirubrobacteraceae bacterium]
MSERAIIIGAGPNGLAAAIRLAEAGLAVTVLEAVETPGGAVRTEELTLPGFHHDVFSAVYPASAASPVFARLPLGAHGLEWVHPEICMAHVVCGDRAVALHRDLTETAAALDAQGAGDGRRWQRFVEPYLEHFDAVRGMMLSGFPPVAGVLALLGRTGPAKTVDFARLLTGSAAGLGGRLFAGSAARAWLYGAAMHGDVLPTGAGSAIAGFYLQLLGHAVGWPSPRGGAARITDALVAHLESLGGTLRTGARVEQITVRGGWVAGVGVAGGEELAADAVVADVLPGALLRMAGPALSGWYRAMLARYRLGPATVKLDWALDGPIPWQAPEARRAGTVHVGGDEPELLASLEGAHRGLPERPFLLLGQQTVADPTRAPKGAHTAWAYTHGPRGLATALGAPERVAAIEAQIERFAPGFRERIVARHVLAPAELQARDANVAGGDVGAGSYRLRQAVFRPIPRLTPYKTPIRGLYLGSAATFPGGAVHGVPGDAAARALLRARALRR